MKRQIMRTWAEVDLGRIRANIASIRSSLPDGVRFMGVVKANAYGHGAVPVAKTMEEAGADYLAVACLNEAIELREGGVRLPILILGITPPEFAYELEEYDIAQAVSSLDYAERLNAGLRRPICAHIKFETGMGRTGFCAASAKQMEEAKKALSLPKLDFRGAFTHFSVSDEPEQESFTFEQARRFEAAVSEAEKSMGKAFELKHCANTGAVINYPQLALDMVRPGVAVYGMYPAAEHGALELSPALSLRSRIYAINEHTAGDTISYGRTFTASHDMLVAVVPIGYADGLHRALSGKLEVLVRGRRCRQIGRICMDMCMVDVTDLPECCVGDIVTLIGSDGDEQVLASELAEKAGTINYEITCALSERVPRVYT